MTKNTPLSFIEHQQSLFKKGMAISAGCTKETSGRIVFSQISKNPSCDLQTTMRQQLLKALSERCQELNQETHKSVNPDLSDTEYAALLIKEFEEERKNLKFRYPKLPSLEWIDSDNPWSGIVLKTKREKNQHRKPPHLLHRNRKKR